MDTIDGINYVSAVANIDPREMSKAMFRFVRAAARAATRSRPVEDRAAVIKFRFAPADPVTRTQAQKRFIAKSMASDPCLQFDL